MDSVQEKFDNKNKSFQRIEMPVLDKGCLRLLNVASQYPEGASDRDPARCARSSFDNFENAEKTEAEDLRLAKYLYDHKHGTPFEMVEIWFQMKLPIFVARQFVRHRTAAINEVSGRYVKLPADWYIPDVVGAKPTNGAKQGQSSGLDHIVQMDFKDDLNKQCAKSYKMYEEYLAKGVAPEHARMVLHLNHYTDWVYKMDLRNMLNFLSLRLDSHSQLEARIYATAMYEMLKTVLPHTMAFLETK